LTAGGNDGIILGFVYGYDVFGDEGFGDEIDGFDVGCDEGFGERG